MAINFWASSLCYLWMTHNYFCRLTRSQYFRNSGHYSSEHLWQMAPISPTSHQRPRVASESQRELDGDHGRGRRTHGAISRRQARTVHSNLNANCKIIKYWFILFIIILTFYEIFQRHQRGFFSGLLISLVIIINFTVVPQLKQFELFKPLLNYLSAIFFFLNLHICILSRYKDYYKVAHYLVFFNQNK